MDESEAQITANRIIEKFVFLDGYNDSIDLRTCPEAFLAARLAVKYILSANPHENPLNNPEPKSTFSFWLHVQDAILKREKEIFGKYLNDVKP